MTEPVSVTGFKRKLRELVDKALEASAMERRTLAGQAKVTSVELSAAISADAPVPTRDVTRAIVAECLRHTDPLFTADQRENVLAGWEQRRQNAEVASNVARLGGADRRSGLVIAPPGMDRPRGEPVEPERVAPIRRIFGAVRARVRRHPRVTIVAVVSVVLAAVLAPLSMLDDEHPCVAAGLTLIDGECVGVTDAAFTDFDTASKEVVARIQEQNRKLDGDYVTIALLGPLSQPGDPERPGQLDSEQAEQLLTGAALAQQRVNSTPLLRDTRPRIRLLLANTGARQTHWQAPVQQLIDIAGNPAEHLVAVIPIGTSVVPTRDAALALSHAGIPLVAAIATAEDFDYAHIDGMLRASPTTSDYVAALADRIQNVRDSSAIVVWDQNSETRGDLFTGGLQKAFHDKLGKWIGNLNDQGFVGATIPGDTWPRDFDNVTINICQSGADIVLYAGRVTDLSALIDSLAHRGCPRPLRIISAAAAFTSVDRTAREKLQKAGLTLTYAGVTDPHTWPDGRGDPPPGYLTYAEALAGLGGDSLDSADAYTCLAHDAVLTATQAIRLATRNPRLPKPPDVLTQLRNLNTAYAIPGCSGTLSYNTTSNGAPMGTPIQIVTIP
ncbi:ABC transporter substrate-binding protein [Nocardia bovistercoris]|uniref:Amino acid ABC transporter substrate-binding protein n=1 Tax=Nocardia bovistercoris TaxID=2785916 RepID=A0A931N662_9NOCA|nr:ABC transporter substrate-binding protein [Nocardia bovistercoris]MBH0779363.1 amino acid ABC transporter substrate-binding protein [Nocardia bovistercoris]